MGVEGEGSAVKALGTPVFSPGNKTTDGELLRKLVNEAVELHIDLGLCLGLLYGGGTGLTNATFQDKEAVRTVVLRITEHIKQLVRLLAETEGAKVLLALLRDCHPGERDRVKANRAKRCSSESFRDFIYNDFLPAVVQNVQQQAPSWELLADKNVVHMFGEGLEADDHFGRPLSPGRHRFLATHDVDGANMAHHDVTIWIMSSLGSKWIHKFSVAAFFERYHHHNSLLGAGSSAMVPCLVRAARAAASPENLRVLMCLLAAIVGRDGSGLRGAGVAFSSNFFASYVAPRVTRLATLNQLASGVWRQFEQYASPSFTDASLAACQHEFLGMVGDQPVPMERVTQSDGKRRSSTSFWGQQKRAKASMTGQEEATRPPTVDRGVALALDPEPLKQNAAFYGSPLYTQAAYLSRPLTGINVPLEELNISELLLGAIKKMQDIASTALPVAGDGFALGAKALVEAVAAATTTQDLSKLADALAQPNLVTISRLLVKIAAGQRSFYVVDVATGVAVFLNKLLDRADDMSQSTKGTGKYTLTSDVTKKLVVLLMGEAAEAPDTRSLLRERHGVFEDWVKTVSVAIDNLYEDFDDLATTVYARRVLVELFPGDAVAIENLAKAHIRLLLLAIVQQITSSGGFGRHHQFLLGTAVSGVSKDEKGAAGQAMTGDFDKAVTVDEFRFARRGNPGRQALTKTARVLFQFVTSTSKKTLIAALDRAKDAILGNASRRVTFTLSPVGRRFAKFGPAAVTISGVAAGTVDAKRLFVLMARNTAGHKLAPSFSVRPRRVKLDDSFVERASREKNEAQRALFADVQLALKAADERIVGNGNRFARLTSEKKPSLGNVIVYLNGGRAQISMRVSDSSVKSFWKATEQRAEETRTSIMKPGTGKKARAKPHVPLHRKSPRAGTDTGSTVDTDLEWNAAKINLPVVTEAMTMKVEQQHGLWLSIVIVALTIEHWKEQELTPLPAERKRQPNIIISDATARTRARLDRTKRMVSNQIEPPSHSTHSMKTRSAERSETAETAADLREQLSDIWTSDTIVDRVNDARKLTGLSGDVQPLFSFASDPDLNRFEFRLTTVVHAVELVRAREAAANTEPDFDRDSLFSYQTPVGNSAYSSAAQLFLTMKSAGDTLVNRTEAEAAWQSWTPRFSVPHVGRRVRVRIGNIFLPVNVSWSMNTVAQYTGTTLKEARASSRQAKHEFLKAATDSDLQLSADIDMAKRRERIVSWSTFLCDAERIGDDVRGRRLTQRFFDQVAQYFVDIARVFCGSDATAAFFIGDGAFTSNAAARQILDWPRIRRIFARHGYCFVVAEANTSQRSACCLAPVIHPTRKVKFLESNRSFKFRINQESSERAKEDVRAVGRIFHNDERESYSSSVCSRCSSILARDTSSADLIEITGVVAMSADARPAALIPRLASQLADKAQAPATQSATASRSPLRPVPSRRDRRVPAAAVRRTRSSHMGSTAGEASSPWA